MKLKEYAARIAKLAKKYPEATVIYARDEEGNGFEECIIPCMDHQARVDAVCYRVLNEIGNDGQF